MWLHADDKVHVQSLLPPTSAILHTRQSCPSCRSQQKQLFAKPDTQFSPNSLLNYFLYSSNSYSVDKKIIATNKVNIAKAADPFLKLIENMQKINT